MSVVFENVQFPDQSNLSDVNMFIYVIMNDITKNI